MLVAACGSSSTGPTYSPAKVATATVANLPIYASPAGAVTNTLANPTIYGAPLTMLVTATQGLWAQVSLPVRPAGSSGWVRADQVTIKADPYQLDVLRGAHELKVYQNGALQKTYPVGIGKTETPTPGGTYYLRVLLKVPNPAGAYGPYAYGLSGFSPVLKDYAGGDGIIGLHGTDQPQVVGTDVSHGCIRLRNADITELVQKYQLPLGTPVRILA